MDIDTLRAWLTAATPANVVDINDDHTWIYDKIPLQGTVTMKNGLPVINTEAPSTCEALIYSPSFGLLLVRSTPAVVSHGGKQHERVLYFAEHYPEARALDVKKIVNNLQGDTTIRVPIEAMKAHHLSVIIGFAPGQDRCSHFNPKLHLPMPWTP